MAIEGKVEVKELIETLKNGIKEYRNSDKFKEMLDTMSKFYHYSLGNMLLILSQKQTATYCGSMKFWNSLGRYVSKGEHGLKILCPNIYETEEEVKDKEGNPVLDKEGKPEKVKRQAIGFSVGNTFDISQTYGKELNLGIKELTGEGLNMPNFLDTMKEIGMVKSISIQPIAGASKGYFDPQNKEIVVKEGMSDLQTTKTVVHETAHAVVFENEDFAKQFNRNQHEIIAESVAYVVCKRFGLDTSEYSFNYVNGWAGSSDEEIEKCVDAIATTSSNIIKKMEDKLGLKNEIEIKKETYKSNAPVKKQCSNTKQRTYKKEISKK